MSPTEHSGHTDAGSGGFTDLPDLAARCLGGSVIAANDELFADKENLVRDANPVHTPGTFGTKGQVYDGWETRRRRAPGHDWAIVRLGAPGVIHGVVIDTAFFRGNYPPECSVEACRVEGYPSTDDLRASDWTTVVPRCATAGDTRNAFAVRDPERYTHVRLSIYPDGGVARLRVHGEPVPDPRAFDGMPLDLAALVNGGRVVDASNRFYARPDNLLLPGLARVMGDGWETARRRDGGNDWVVVRLAARGKVRVVELDTTHFVGNAPGAAIVHGYDAGQSVALPAPPPELDKPAAGGWAELLPLTRLQPDTPHRFVLQRSTPVTHVRLDIHPDGGMSRFRCFGTLTSDGYDALLKRWNGP